MKHIDAGGYIGEAMEAAGMVRRPYIAAVTVPGPAKGQPRPRAFSRGGHAAVYDPGTAEGWKSQIALAFKDVLPPEPLTGPVAVSIRARFERPKSHYRKAGLAASTPVEHCQKPDIDNLAKAVLDALTTLRLWKDDAQVVSLEVERSWTLNNSETYIRVEERTAARPA